MTRARSLPQDRWVLRRTDRMPAPVAAVMLERHAGLVGARTDVSTSPYYVANQWIAKQQSELLKARVWNAFDEQDIRDYAENYAGRCAHMPMLIQRELFAASVGVEPPVAKFLTDRYEGRAARLADPLWWRRQLRKVWTRSAENAMRFLGVVRKHRAPYVSDDALRYRQGQKRKMADYLERHVLVNEIGEQLNLFDVAQASIANPTLRRGEFMTRVRGFEELADTFGHEAIFFTLTAPSAFHAQLAAGGDNPAFLRKVVRDAQGWLCKMWARARAALHRRKVLIYGFRVAEPHHDGTPHWHGLVFTRAHHTHVVSDILSRVWLREFGDEPGARRHRVRVEAIDRSKGSAAGYIAKYVAKNIDAHGSVGEALSDETDEPVRANVGRVDAWASIHGIRQFQQLGGPPVGLYRECRRLRDEVDDIDIERCRRAADRGDWRQFCRSVGGDFLTRRTSLKLWKEETGEKSMYGECRGKRVVGVRFASAEVVTRPHRWRVERKGRGRHVAGIASCLTTRTKADSLVSSLRSSIHLPLGPVAITVRGRKYNFQPSGNPDYWICAETSTAPPSRGR